MQLELSGIDEYISAQALERLFTVAAAHVGMDTDFLLAVSLVDDAESRRLNKQYRGKDTPTDVLSFGYEDGKQRPQPGEKTRYLGDVVIAEGVARVQAREQEHPFADELYFLLVHGFLHLLGHDPERALDAQKMSALHERIIQTFYAKD